MRATLPLALLAAIALPGAGAAVAASEAPAASFWGHSSDAAAEADVAPDEAAPGDVAPEDVTPEDMAPEEVPPDADAPANDGAAVVPVPSREFLQQAFDACTAVGSADPDGAESAETAGWIAYGAEDGGPFKSIYSAYQAFAGYGRVELWSSVETYPTQRLGYCRLDFADYAGTLDPADFAQTGGLQGSVKDLGDGAFYGSWETPDHAIMVIADRDQGEVEIEFNLLLSSAPPPPPPDAPVPPPPTQL